MPLVPASLVDGAAVRRPVGLLAPMLLALVGCAQDVTLGAGALAVDPVDILPCEFTPISGTKLSVYDCNPVFTSVDEDWSAGVISVAFRAQAVLGAPVFQVWYSSELEGFEGWGLGHAVSSDGIEWMPHPDNPLYGPTTGWDRERATAVNVAYDVANDEFALAYQGRDLPNDSLGMGVLVSPNGVRWREPDAGSLLYDLTDPEQPICWPLGLSWSESRGYFGFLAANGPGRTCEATRFDAPSLSADAVELDRGASLRAGPRPYDASGMTSVATAELDGVFYLFYTGFRTWEPAEEEGFIRTFDTSVGVATSADGIFWDKIASENPLPIPLTEPGEVGGLGAQAIGDRIHLWVTDEYEELDQKGIGYYLYEPSIEAHP